MAASISQQLADLLNPLPNFQDPEDDQDEETKAKLVDKFDEGDEDEGLRPSALRKRNATLLADSDKRYRGKVTSRKDLLKDFDGSSEEDEDFKEELKNLTKDEHDDDDEDDVDDDDNEEEEMEEEKDEEDGLTDDDSLKESNLITKIKDIDLMLPKDTDFTKLTEGMDDLGESEEEEEDDEDDEKEEEEGESEGDSEEDEDDTGAVMTFSKQKVDEEVERGRAVQNQLALWDQVLEGRIKIQKALVTANQLPQPEMFKEFKNKGGEKFAGALKNSHKALKALQRSLLELQDLLLYQNPETRSISQGKTWDQNSKAKEEVVESDEDELEEDNDEEMETDRKGPPKRKLEMAEYPDFMSKRFATFQPYRDATLQHWYDKTRLTTGKSNKGFGSFERNILTQVEQVLMDKERLLRRTQTRRSDYRVLGKPELSAITTQSSSVESEVSDVAFKANVHLKDLDEEIFDDDDFYHQLLRELIESKTSASDPNDQVAMGRQWLAIQKLRSKIKKKVDTKASKGRKVRFHIHSKLVNFMAPIDHSSMSNEARSDLYRSLFSAEPVY